MNFFKIFLTLLFLIFSTFAYADNHTETQSEGVSSIAQEIQDDEEVSLNELIISSNKSSNFIELRKISSSICFFEICFNISPHLLV